jgi:regulator of RNase E activity RraB
MMGIFGKLFGSRTRTGPFQTEKQFIKNTASQISTAPQILEQLRQCGVGEERELRLEFFFYSDKEPNSEELNGELVKLGYESAYAKSAGDPSLFVINGWTSPIRMDETTVTDWAERMCKLGYDHDAEFNGWGTDPTQ